MDIKTEITDSLLELPEKIKTIEFSILETQNTILELKHKNNLWEMLTLSEIQKELNDQGKQKFSNENLRQAELESRKDSKFKKIEMKIDTLNNKFQELKIELNYLNNIQSNYKSLINLIKND